MTKIEGTNAGLGDLHKLAHSDHRRSYKLPYQATPTTANFEWHTQETTRLLCDYSEHVSNPSIENAHTGNDQWRKAHRWCQST